MCSLSSSLQRRQGGGFRCCCGEFCACCKEKYLGVFPSCVIFFLPDTFGMTNPNHAEKFDAICVVRLASDLAKQRSNPCDHIAAAVAVLVRAVELATPDLSSEARASLFHQFPAKSASE